MAELKRKLIELCKARGKHYGILVQRMDLPVLGRAGRGAPHASRGRRAAGPISLPLLTYRVYPGWPGGTGPQRSVSRLECPLAEGHPGRGRRRRVFDLMDSPAVFALIGASPYTTEASVIAPSILIDDLELHPIEAELPKLPLVPAPAMTR